MKKLTAIVLSMALALSLTACGEKTPSSKSEERKTVKLGILQLLEHPALDSAREGFVKALADAGYTEGENLEIDLQNAQNDQSNLYTMSQRLVNKENDIILAIGTGSAQSLAAQTQTIPVLITAVTDPVDSGLAQSLEAPGTNVTGTSDASPIQAQIELIKTLVPSVQTVGVLYTSSEDNSIVQAKQAKEIIEKLGLTYTEQTVTSVNDVQQATQSLVTKCDAIYIPTDNTLAASMALVGEIVKESKTPVVCGESNMVVTGGLATLGIDYYNLGYQTGEMAVRILNGESPAAMAIETQKNFEYVINGEMAQAIGIEIPQELQQYIK